MKICFLSDIHGDFPEMPKEKIDVVAIAGDIFPLRIQCDTIRSTVWFTQVFIPWCLNLDCERVILVAGNHDFMFQNIVEDTFRNSSYSKNTAAKEEIAATVIMNKLMLPTKIVYLQDSSFLFGNIKFYGTPWCPDLENWAFYKSKTDLVKAFKKIPKDCDVLISHAAGTENNFGTSLGISTKPNYGCKELTECVKKSNIKIWAAGHIHSGNHEPSLLSNGKTKIVNVSIKDEEYRIAYEPIVIEI